MEPSELLIRKARDYEVLAASHEERAGLDRRTEHLTVATVFVATAIVLREVAAALDEEGRD
ncbi:MAG: hypothetical protein OEV29_13870 [Thermoleophilia bacterium]|nr:hypothetical protein [Thermoleophilia bacterium]